VVERDEFVAMQAALENVYVAESLGRYIVEIVRATRARAGVEVGASPRGSLALMLAGRARAVLAGRDLPAQRAARAAERIDAILPEIDRMMGGGLITLERAHVIIYRPHGADVAGSSDTRSPRG